MALADGRLVPHGKHADLHRRAINVMKGRFSSNLQVKWVPSHKDEEGVKAGLISQEHMEGNKEADSHAWSQPAHRARYPGPGSQSTGPNGQ
eukprot:14022971-Heterocapsa_arctica.AAC.1